MIKSCLAISTLFIYSCSTKNSFESRKWEALDTTRGLSYSVSEKGKGEKGDISIKYWGWIENNEYIQDTVAESLHMLENLITPVMENKNEIRQLPAGTTGFIKVNMAGFFEASLSEATHYILYFTGQLSDKVLKEDSVKLESLGVFRKIEITNHQQAIDKFIGDEDTTWKSFIKSNPLPASIDLTLKKEFLSKVKYDSIKNILSELLPVSEIQSPYLNGVLDSGNGKKQELVYKFVIF